MSKGRFWIVLAALLIGVVLIAQAQDNPPLTQPTIDAQVATLLAQTQTAVVPHQTEVAATRTIQAALAQALTGTAQALLPTATPTPLAFQTAALTVAGTTDIDLLAGPARTAAYLAPDGAHFAYLKGSTLCLYAGDQQQQCVDVSQLGSIDSETPRWSPDSRYLAFNENFFQYFRDPDIWVWDTANNVLRDITDDGQTKLALSDPNWRNIDVLPHWLPDGHILFLRYNKVNGQPQPPQIYTIAPGWQQPHAIGAAFHPRSLCRLRPGRERHPDRLRLRRGQREQRQ